MKTIILTMCLLLTLMGQAQTTTAPTEPPYKRFPNLLPFKVLTTDSTTWYTREDLPKKKPVLIMLFSPDCDHCQHQTDSLIANMDALKEVQILMVTVQDFDKMKDFYNRYDLSRFKNLVMGRDPQFTFMSFFQAHYFPVLAFYNRKKELISMHEGTMPIAELLAEIKKG